MKGLEVTKPGGLGWLIRGFFGLQNTVRAARAR